MFLLLKKSLRSVTLPESASVDDLRRMKHHPQYVPFDKQYIRNYGQWLDPDRKLSSCNIHDGATVNEIELRVCG